MLNDTKHIFFVGIKGVAMANLARMFSQMGKRVTGSDVADEFITDHTLEQSNIGVITSFSEEALPKDTDLLVYSASHGGHSNPQVVEALKRGIAVKHQADIIGELSGIFKHSIAVAGCHGKTTTSGMLAFVLHKLGVAESHLVGVSQFNDQLGGEYRGNEYFIFEADEYGIDPPQDKTPKFLKARPTHAIVTNIDFDHPDVYASFDETFDAYKQFMKKILIQSTTSHSLVLNGDDAALRDYSDALSDKQFLLYGSTPDCDVWYSKIVSDEYSTSFRISSDIFEVPDITVYISLFGEKNVSNAASVITMCLHLGFDIEDICRHVKGYTGAKRRFEFKWSENGITLFDDYAHHPAEIDATIKAIQSRFPNQRLIVIFQPHTFTRTELFKEEFVEALSEADHALLLPIFASAREDTIKKNITSEMLIEIAKSKHIRSIEAFSNSEELILKLKKIISEGDIICTMGAGDVYKLDGEIRKLI